MKTIRLMIGAFLTLLTVLGLFAAAPRASAQEFRAGTLNCYWLYRYNNPDISWDRLNDEKIGDIFSGARWPLTEESWERKLNNLTGVIVGSGARVIGLQEVGGRGEAEELAQQVARSADMRARVAFVRAGDGSTQRNVAAIVLQEEGPRGLKLKGWKQINSLGSIRHLLVQLENAETKVPLDVLVIDLQGDNSTQLSAHLDQIKRWARSIGNRRNLMILGDTEFKGRPPAPFDMKGWTDAFQDDASITTTTIRPARPVDRIVVGPTLTIGNPKIWKFTKNPEELEDDLVKENTDHFFVTADVVMP